MGKHENKIQCYLHPAEVERLREFEKNNPDLKKTGIVRKAVKEFLDRNHDSSTVRASGKSDY